MPGTAVINFFTASRTTIDKGSSVTLSWSTSFCTSVTLNGSSVGLSGSKVVTPVSTTTYTLRGIGERGAPSRSLTITVAGTGGGGGGGTGGGGGGRTTTYTFYVTTDPGGCTISISGVGTFTSLSAGNRLSIGVAAGTRTVTVSKTGYQSISESRVFNRNWTVTYVLTPMPVICVPGAQKCTGVDLYECNANGTAWALKQANSPTCQAQGQTPDFWTDPVGWVIAVIAGAWASITGFVQSAFKILQRNVNNFMARYSTALVAFIKDPVGKITSWIGGTFAKISDVVSTVGSSISSWWSSTSSTVKGWINNAVAGINTWISDFSKNITAWWNSTMGKAWSALQTVVSGIQGFINVSQKTLTDWWTSASASVKNFFDSTWSSLTEFWNGVASHFTSWWADVRKSIGAWWSSTVKALGDAFNTFYKDVSDFISGIPGEIQGFINTAVKSMQTWTVQTINDMVGAMFDWAKPIVKPIQDAVGFLGSLVGVVTGSYPKNENVKELQDKQQRLKQEIRDYYELRR